MARYKTILTDLGAVLLTRALALQQPVNINSVQMGSGVYGGEQAEITELVSPVKVNTKMGDKEFIEGDPSLLKISVQTLNNGLTKLTPIREIGLFADDILFAYAWIEGEDTDNILPPPLDVNVADTIHMHELALFVTNQENASIEVSFAFDGFVSQRQLGHHVESKNVHLSEDERDFLDDLKDNDVINTKAPINHASITTDFGSGTGINFGHVKLSDEINSDNYVNDGVASTPLALKTVNEMLRGKIEDLESDVKDLEERPTSEVPTNHASTTTEFGVGSVTLHGHVRASSATPLVAGTVAVGTDNGLYARGDHRHPLQTTVTGNAGTATALQTARTINGVAFNGTQNITITSTSGQVGTVRNVRTVRLTVFEIRSNNVWVDITVNLPFNGTSTRYAINSQLPTLGASGEAGNGLMTIFTNNTITFRPTHGSSSPFSNTLVTVYTIVEYF